MNYVFVNSLYPGLEGLIIPLGLLSLVTILNKDENNAEIIDFNYLYSIDELKKSCDSQENIEIMADYILAKNPKLIGFHSMCGSYHNNLMIAKCIKEKNPSLPIIFGGPQVSLTARSSMEAFPWIDLIAIGEAERTIEKIIQAFEGQIPFTSIPGILYRKQGEIVSNNEQEFIENLDSLPILDYSLISYINDLETIPIEAGRGCPYECTYCSTKTFWKRKFRLKDPQRLIDECKDLYFNYGKNKFNFIHDLFTVNKAKVMDFCEKVLEEHLPIKWGCSARIDTLDEELIQKMSEAGCKDIYLGIETGSPTMQKISRKNLDLSLVWEKIELLGKYNIEVILSFIYGFPQETITDLEQTLDMIQKALDLGIRKVQLHLCTLMAGTELYDQYHSNLTYNGILSDSTSNVNLSSSKEMILKYPDIFPHFFNLDTEIRTKYQNLGRFMTDYYIALYDNLPNTYSLLLAAYDHKILDLSADMESYIPEHDFGHEFLYSSFDILDFTVKKLNDLEAFINNLDLSENVAVIREMFRFERDIFNFLYIDEDKEYEEHNYQFDLFTAKMENYPLHNITEKPIKVTFERFDLDQVEIKKVDL